MPSVFDLAASVARAEARLGRVPERPGRRARSDRGRSRIAPEVRAALSRLLAGAEYPGAEAILEALAARCRRLRRPCPSRATLYNLMSREPGRSYPLALQPPAVRAALYNLEAEGCRVPGAQLAFYCFNHGELAALHFAAALPWLALYQASRLPGWRPRSRGLLRAVLQDRGIPGA